MFLKATRGGVILGEMCVYGLLGQHSGEARTTSGSTKAENWQNIPEGQKNQSKVASC